MSGGYEVVLTAIESSAGAAKRAAEVVRPTDLAAGLATVSAGLPGGVSSEAARLLADAWGRAVPGWVENVDAYSAQLDQAVARYRSNEQAAVADLHPLVPGGGRRPV